MNATMFKHCLGIKPPRTPITPKAYAQSKMPFFKIYEEPSGIFGKFETLKSIGELDAEADKKSQPGQKRKRDTEENNLSFPVIDISSCTRSFVPVSDMIAKVKKTRFADI